MKSALVGVHRSVTGCEGARQLGGAVYAMMAGDLEAVSPPAGPGEPTS